MEDHYSGSSTPDADMTRRLQEAQQKVTEAPAERRAAVLAAKTANKWSERRIARVLGVDPSTVRAILAAASKGDPS